MNLKRLRQFLRLEIQAEANKAWFVQMRSEKDMMAKFETPDELLKVLRSNARLQPPDREMLVREMLNAHGERPHSLWTALLVLVCYPMLSRLRGRIHGAQVDGDECDQLVVSSFLEVVALYATQPVRDRIFMRLRQRTHRLVFHHLKHERRVLERIRPTPPGELQMYEAICLEEHRSSPWPEMRPRHPKDRSPIEREEQITFLECHARAVLSREKLEPVIATLVHGERLRQYVERTHPLVTGAEHQRLYQRIKRRHSRAIRELRELFTEHRHATRGLTAG